MSADPLHIGTCSWKYDSWRGLIYPERGRIDYLREYSRSYRTVEVDQWFWSLFAGDAVVLPKNEVVRGYAASVPEDFIFAVKVPNSITLTHHYRKNKAEPLRPNPHFCSPELMERFLETLAPLGGRLGPLIFQFEYLNKQKMSGLGEFIDRFGAFTDDLPGGYVYCVETRNPNYLKLPYFEFLAGRGLTHVFAHGYYMPPIFAIYETFATAVSGRTVIRLLGPDRQEIERRTSKRWNTVAAPKDDDIARLRDMLEDLGNRGVETFLYVNNHFEGSAPRTITRIERALG